MSALRKLVALKTRRPLFVAVSLTVLAFLLAVPVVDAVLRSLAAGGDEGLVWVQTFHYNDFGSYATATARLAAGKEIYWRNPGGGFFGTYLYPPVYVLLFIPWMELQTSEFLVGLPLAKNLTDVSALLFEICSALLLWVGLQRIARNAGLELAWYDRLVGLWALVGFWPLLFSVKLGQVSAFVAATFCFAYLAMEAGTGPGGGRGYRLASGVLTVVAAGIKPYYATAGAHLLRDRERFAGAVLGTVGLVTLSLLTLGVANNVAYLDVLFWGKGWLEGPQALYLWHPGYFEPLYVVGNISPLLSGALRALLVVTVAAVAFLARDGDVRRETFALGLAVYPLVAPETYAQDFVALLVAAAVLLVVEFETADGYPWIPVAAVGLLASHTYGLRLLGFYLPARLPAGEVLRSLAPALQPGLWGCVLLVGLGLYRVIPRSGLTGGQRQTWMDRSRDRLRGSSEQR